LAVPKSIAISCVKENNPIFLNEELRMKN